MKRSHYRHQLRLCVSKASSSSCSGQNEPKNISECINSVILCFSFTVPRFFKISRRHISYDINFYGFLHKNIPTLEGRQEKVIQNTSIKQRF